VHARQVVTAIKRLSLNGPGLRLRCLPMHNAWNTTCDFLAATEPRMVISLRRGFQ
jgi:hypothetical protein